MQWEIYTIDYVWYPRWQDKNKQKWPSLLCKHGGWKAISKGMLTCGWSINGRGEWGIDGKHTEWVTQIARLEKGKFRFTRLDMEQMSDGMNK